MTDSKIHGIASFNEAYDALMSARPGMLASESGGELGWLHKARERDAARWRAEGLPSRKDERWHYTSVAPIAESRIVVPGVTTPVKIPARSAFGDVAGDWAAKIVFYNGQFVPEWSDFGSQDCYSIVVLEDLFEECVNQGWTEERRAKFEYFRKHVETSEAVRENVFAAINTSFMQDGVLVYVKPGKVLRKPILVSYLADSAINSGNGSHDLAMVAPRVFAHLDRGAEAAIVEHYTGLDGHRYFTNAVSDVRLEPGARLSYCKIQMEGADGINIGTTRIRQARDAWSESFQFTFGGKLSRQDLHVTLDGENAEAIFDGLYMVKGKQHVDHYTSVDHAVPHTQSEQVYKGILADEARAVFNGRVHIHRDAQKSNASQLNNNLMLSRRAEVDTKPELDIEADDVKAAHGATIGRIDPEQIFYLQTRSVPKSEAVRMLARGYAHDVVFRIKNDEIRKAVGLIVDQRFDEMKVEEAAEVSGV